jgi:hypothetical protein
VRSPLGIGAGRNHAEGLAGAKLAGQRRVADVDRDVPDKPGTLAARGALGVADDSSHAALGGCEQVHLDLGQVRTGDTGVPARGRGFVGGEAHEQ